MCVQLTHRKLAGIDGIPTVFEGHHRRFARLFRRRDAGPDRRADLPLFTVYDMCKAVERGMTITDVRLLEKHGGKSGSCVVPA